MPICLVNHNDLKRILKALSLILIGPVLPERIKASSGKRVLLVKEVPETLDGPAIRNASRGDSRESICANQFAEKLL